MCFFYYLIRDLILGFNLYKKKRKNSYKIKSNDFELTISAKPF